LQEVGTKATSSRSVFANKLAPWKAAANDKGYRAANMTADKQLQFPICLSAAETDVTTCTLADTQSITNQLEREINGITSNKQIRFKKEFSLSLIDV
jgi:hypothetical protein